MLTQVMDKVSANFGCREGYSHSITQLLAELKQYLSAFEAYKEEGSPVGANASVILHDHSHVAI